MLHLAQTPTFAFVAQVLMPHAKDAHGEPVTLVGTAEVELSLLHVMGQVSGWYNIVNSRCASLLPHSHTAA